MLVAGRPLDPVELPDERQRLRARDRRRRHRLLEVPAGVRPAADFDDLGILRKHVVIGERRVHLEIPTMVGQHLQRPVCGELLIFDTNQQFATHRMSTGCVRCFPVLTTKGKFHACPFAAEIDSPHYDLGSVGTDPDKVFENYRRFRNWADETLDPTARTRGISSCEMCHKFLNELRVPEYVR